MVKVREVKHSDEEISSRSSDGGEEGEFESGEDNLMEMMGSEGGEDEMYDDEEDGELEMMELAPGESESETNSNDMEEEMVAELMANKKEMNKMQKEMKQIMGNQVEDTEQTQDAEEEESVNDNESMDSDIKLAAYNKQAEEL